MCNSSRNVEKCGFGYFKTVSSTRLNMSSATSSIHITSQHISSNIVQSQLYSVVRNSELEYDNLRKFYFCKNAFLGLVRSETLSFCFALTYKSENYWKHLPLCCNFKLFLEIIENSQALQTFREYILKFGTTLQVKTNYFNTTVNYTAIKYF